MTAHRAPDPAPPIASRRRRNRLLTVRVTADELAMYARTAAAMNITTGALVRALLLTAERHLKRTKRG